ncbi:hypothetical protein BH10PSE7_BH10PSE7_27890 [soil metagenome]
MSSPTSAIKGPGIRLAERAALRARLSRPLAGILALLVIVLTGVFIYQVSSVRGPGEPVIDPKKAVPPTEEVTVRDSTVTGFDKNQLPYSVSAVSGVQDRDKPNLIKLQTVSGETRRANGEVVTIAARTGVYNSDSRVFDLEGDVVIGMPGRFTARMDRAAITVADKVLKTQVPVTVSTGQGTINSNALEIGNDGKRILFFNGVKVRFRQSGSKGDNSP